MQNDFSAIVLAGGKGKRMNGNTPKVLEKIGGKPLIFWSLDMLKNLGISDVVVVTGYKHGELKKVVEDKDYAVTYARQARQLGTAHAVRIGLKKTSRLSRHIFVLYGDDSALYKKSTIRKFLKRHADNSSPLTILVYKEKLPTRVGGIERDGKGNVTDVLSQQEMLEKGISENETLCGAFCFDRAWLEKNINKIKKGPLKGEYPLPVLINFAAKEGNFAETFQISDKNEWASVNTREELVEARNKYSKHK